MFRDLRLFFREFRRSFHTTGAIAPSGPALSAALARPALELAGPRRVLEVGPGTGVVTRCLARGWRPEDRLDIVEINPVFAEVIREKLQRDAAYQSLAGSTNVVCAAIETAPLPEPYDAVISGLPLNNFDPLTVRRILGILTTVVRPGGTVSFFEYAAIRGAKQRVASRDERQRLRQVGRELANVFADHDCRRETIWLNIPPAWVHHLRRRGSP